MGNLRIMETVFSGRQLQRIENSDIQIMKNKIIISDFSLVKMSNSISVSRNRIKLDTEGIFSAV